MSPRDLALVLLFAGAGCVSPTAFQTARTLPKREMAAGGAISLHPSHYRTLTEPGRALGRFLLRHGFQAGVGIQVVIPSRRATPGS